MEHKTARLSALFLACALLLACLAGCAGPGDGTEPTDTQPPATQTPSGSGGIEKNDDGYRQGGQVSDAYVDPDKTGPQPEDVKAQGYVYDRDRLTYELVWSDEFDYEGAPDPAKWGYDVGGSGWGNQELQYYTPGDNVTVGDGVLTIELRNEKVNNMDYTSTRLVTRQKGDWLYCKVEVSAKLPTGRGTWPAIWMLPTDRRYGEWPASGEIDIMEHVGYDQDNIVQTVHCGKYYGGSPKSHTVRTAGVSEEFHTYTMEWLPDKLIFSVDGVEQFTYDPNKFTSKPTKEYWPFDQRFHLLINLAYGGTWGGAHGVDDSCLPAEYQIDYVRVYQSPEILKLTEQAGEPGGDDMPGNVTQPGEGNLPARTNFHLDAFGENVWIFSPNDDPEAVNAELAKIWAQQETNQFGDQRYAVYFLPGTYDESIEPKVGFYTQIAGLGVLPDDVSLRSIGCDARWLGDDGNHNATCNFWRGVENLSARHYVTWAVSQATFMRRVHLQKTLYLHDANGWASGGFLANSQVDLAVNSGSQQQWLSRNCDWTSWMGENWNIVFAGIEPGKAPAATWPEHAYTAVLVVEEIREKPFLTFDGERGFGVYVPGTRQNAVGVDWDPGEFLPMDAFYIAKPGIDSAKTVNEAIAAGKHIFLTPGVYELTEPIVLDREGAILLGSGLATLRSMEGNACLEVPGNTGVTVAGILFDAGPKPADHLLAVGTEGVSSDGEDREATLLADVFFRVGGAKGYDTEVDCCVELHQDGIIGDNFWVWRADHGSGVGWERNRAKNGIRVTGDGVTVYALMVEHFREYQTIWEGEEGKIVFYQCEIPYDVPSQEVWMSHDGTVNGYASIKIADTVKNHESWGLGIYLYNRDATVDLHTAMEAPASPGVLVHNICTVMLTGNPGMSHIINDDGDAVTWGGARAILTQWQGGTQ